MKTHNSRHRQSRFRLMAVAMIVSVAAAGLWGCGRGRADANRLAVMLGVRPGMVVADVGAGGGGMTVVMAGLVGPKGRVFSTDINRRALARIRRAVVAARLDNVTVIKASASDTGLPANCCDAIFLSRVYHHLTDPADTNRSLLRALRPGGKLAVLDFRPTLLLWLWTPKGLPANRHGHGVDPVTVAGEVTHAGFEFLQADDPWPGSWFISSYCLLFEKPPQYVPPPPPAAAPTPSAAGSAPPG